MKSYQALLGQCSANDLQVYSEALPQFQDLYECNSYQLDIYHFQKSIGANPASHIAVKIPLSAFDAHSIWLSEPSSKRGVLDAMLRIFGRLIDSQVVQNQGSDGSGSILVIRPGQEILERNTIVVDERFLEIRLVFSFAGNKKKQFLGTENQNLLIQLNKVITTFINTIGLEQEFINAFIHVSQTHAFIHAWLKEQGGVAFIANGSHLPRLSGEDNRPLPIDKGAILFQSPGSLIKKIQLPDGETISGMVIPEGITLITGGGFHGKSTLLKAIIQGIYPHIPGDGREYIITRKDAFFCLCGRRPIHP